MLSRIIKDLVATWEAIPRVARYQIHNTFLFLVFVAVIRVATGEFVFELIFMLFSGIWGNSVLIDLMREIEKKKKKK